MLNCRRSREEVEPAARSDAEHSTRNTGSSAVGGPHKETNRFSQIFQRAAEFQSEALQAFADSACQRNDSIAITFLDSLNACGNALFDVWNMLDSIRKNPFPNDSAIADIGLKKLRYHGYNIFKADPLYALSRFNDYLSASGKAFFETRARDNLQPCYYDETVRILPFDTLATRIRLWETYIDSHNNTIAAREAKKYLNTYLTVYLSTFRKRMSWELRTPRKPVKAFLATSSLKNYIQRYKGARSRDLIAKVYHWHCSDSFGTKEIEEFMAQNGIPLGFHPMRKDTGATVVFGGSWNGMQKRHVSRYCGNWMAVEANAAGARLISLTPAIDSCYYCDSPNFCLNYDANLFRFALASEYIKEGAVIEAFGGDKPPLPPMDSSYVFHFKRQAYVLLSITPSGCKEENRGYRERLFLMHNGNIYYLLAPLRTSDSKAALLWMGDLDNDGYLDALLDESDHYNVHFYRLHLSSGVSRGRLLRLYAENWVTGC